MLRRGRLAAKGCRSSGSVLPVIRQLDDFAADFAAFFDDHFLVADFSGDFTAGVNDQTLPDRKFPRECAADFGVVDDGGSGERAVGEDLDYAAVQGCLNVTFDYSACWKLNRKNNDLRRLPGYVATAIAS